MRLSRQSRNFSFRQLVSLFLCFGATCGALADTYDPLTNIITIPIVTVGNTAFTNVRASVGRVISFSRTGPASSTHDIYDPQLNQLLISSVVVNGNTFYDVRVEVDRTRPILIGGQNPVSTTNPQLATVDPLPAATVGAAYSTNVVAAVSPSALYTFMMDTLINGSLPTGMTLHANGILSGTPFATGKANVNGYQVANTYSFGVCAVDTVTRFISTPCSQTSITVNPAPFTLTTTISGNGSVTASPKGPDYDPGTVVTLAATPSQGSTFSNWSGSCTGTAACVVTMSGSKSVTATFGTTSTVAAAAGTWSGNWSWSGSGSTGCVTSDIGAMSVTLTQSGTTVSGSNLSAGGVETRWNSDCSLIAVQTATGGSMSLGASGNGYNVQFNFQVGLPNNETLSLSFSGTATLANNTLTGTFVRTTGGTGSFTLQRQ